MRREHARSVVLPAPEKVALGQEGTRREAVFDNRWFDVRYVVSLNACFTRSAALQDDREIAITGRSSVCGDEIRC